MPVKLILFIVMLIVISAFIAFNIEYTSDVSIWPSEKGTFNDVPILISFFVMYMIGVLSVIPFFVGYRYKKGKEKKTDAASKEPKKEETRGKARVLGTKADGDESKNHSKQDSKTE